MDRTIVPGNIFCLLFFCLVGSTLVMAEPRAGQPGAGQLELRGSWGSAAPALHLGSEARFTISGMLARVSLRQSFRNTSGQWVEGRYLFPLPEQAAVNRMRIRVGEREIIGEIRERQQARIEYNKAREQGRKASLVEQQRPNLFSNNIANIAPGETVVVELEYIQTVDYRAGQFSLRFPTTLTARYFPGQPLPDAEASSLEVDTLSGWARNTDRVPDAAEISPPQWPAHAAGQGGIEILVELDAGFPLASVESPYHEIVLQRDKLKYQLQLAGGRAAMDRDFLLQWRPLAGREPQAAVFSESLDGEDYALLMLIPPRIEDLNSLNREVIYVIDTSGSMGGAPIKQARASLAFAISQLGPNDRFNIIEFNSHARRLFARAVDVNPHNLTRAREFVRHLSAGGGTEMRAALRLALQNQEESERVRQVVFITDGAVGNEVELFREIESLLGHSRLFTVGIGSAPNSWFMRKAARFGRGSFTYVSRSRDVQERIGELFSNLQQPVLTDLSVNWGGAAESWPQRIPDLYAGEPLLLSSRLPLLAPGTSVTVTGRLQGQSWQQEIRLASAGSHAGVAATWARRKIAGLLDEKIQGRDAEEVKAEILPLALQHQLVSPYTSFLAVEKRPSRPAAAGLRKHAVPNATPAGQAGQPYSWPTTATPAYQQIALGCQLLLAWLALLFLSHRRRCSHASA